MAAKKKKPEKQESATAADRAEQPQASKLTRGPRWELAFKEGRMEPDHCSKMMECPEALFCPWPECPLING